MADIATLRNFISPHRQTDKNFYLDLLDAEKQQAYEDERVRAVMLMLKAVYVKRLQQKIRECRTKREELIASADYNAEKYREVLELNARIAENERKLGEYKPFFEEPYFARMDLVDGQDGYNSYYIGKHGDEELEIVDWRAPLARKYYQKSKLNFSINQFDYKLVLRRALRTRNGKVLDFQNEYLCVSDYLTKEEIAGRDEAAIFDPYLKDILKSRKEKQEICDIIETIQEQQYDIITAPEDAQFTVQGVAGSGKTMIMLHRLSYLMYNNEDLRPSNVLVITPSDSFNAFIDELSAILELEKVKTTTLESYFLSLLENCGVRLQGKIDAKIAQNSEYLAYIYSDKFVMDADRKLGKIYDHVRGLLTGDAGDFAKEVISACARQRAEYEKIKNAGLRVRRCVLGEIKEKPQGGLYYTKQMRTLFNCVSDAEEFLTVNATDARMSGQAYFYRQLLSFYKSLKFIRRYAHKICTGAIDDLRNLDAVITKEINDLKRYKINVGGEERLTYPERIEKRLETKKEIDATICRVERILSLFAGVFDFADILRGESYFVRIGKCENTVDVVRFFYRELIRPVKQKYGMTTSALCRSDPYAICLVLTRMGLELSPKYSFVFVDEAQDLSENEYGILRAVNANARFNIFGDLRQNITPFRGIGDWKKLGYETYNLNLNYRNTNQIVSFVSQGLKIDMKAIGLAGDEVVTIPPKSVGKFLFDKKGLRAVVTSEANLENYSRKSYNVLRESGRISKSKINVMTVYESKGLEFSAVAVVDGDLTENERYIAYTRALKSLAVVR